MRTAAAVLLLASQSFSFAFVRQRGVSMPLRFEANRGQFPSYIGFVVRAGSESLALRTDGGLMHAVRSADSDSLDIVEVRLCGTRDVVGVGAEPSASVTHYYSGVETNAWKNSVPHFGRVRFPQVYRGIDLVWRASRTIEYQFRVDPGADAGQIRFRIEGATKIRLDSAGNLIIESPAGLLRHHRPEAYQIVNGQRRPVRARFLLMNALLTFELGSYNRDLALIVDPTIGISTYLGGSGYDAGYSIAVDSGGNLYVTGETSSVDFPSAGGGVAPAHSNRDVFVTKLNSAGSNIIYTTILSSSGNDA